MPKLRWHPETGESQEFGPDDPVPEGWLPHHPLDDAKVAAAAALEPKPEEAPKGKDVDPNAPLTKREVVEALKSGGLTFKADAKLPELTDQLVVALKAALDAGAVPYAPDANPRALLALVSVK